MTDYEVEFPNEYVNEAMWEPKGFLPGVVVRRVNGNTFRLTFYDTTRLSQTVSDDIAAGGSFFESNLVVVERVRRSQILEAVEHLAKVGFSGLAPEAPDSRSATS